MSADFWLGVLAIPVFTAAGVGLFFAIIGARVLGGKALLFLFRSYKPVKDGEKAEWGGRYATDFGVRSTFASMSLSARRMFLFEPFEGVGIFIMIDRPKEHTDLTRRAKATIELTYQELLRNEDKP